MKCQLETTGTLPNGRTSVRCVVCGKQSTAKNPATFKMACGGSPAIVTEEVKKAAESRGMLVGDVIASMTKMIGVQPCAACEARREWLNKAHQWVTDWLAESRRHD